MIEIDIHSDDVHFNWENESLVTDWIKEILVQHKHSEVTLSYVYCSDDKLLSINKEYLNHDYYTDVITFDLSDDETINGEIYCSLDRIKENASSLNIPFEQELCRVMIHGVLHLLGWNDKDETQKESMTAKEDACLSLLHEVPRGTFID